MGVVTLFIHTMDNIFLFKSIFQAIKECSSIGALNFEFHPGNLHFRLTQFRIALISNTASDGDSTPPTLLGGK